MILSKHSVCKKIIGAKGEDLIGSLIWIKIHPIFIIKLHPGKKGISLVSLLNEEGSTITTKVSNTEDQPTEAKYHGGATLGPQADTWDQITWP